MTLGVKYYIVESDLDNGSYVVHRAHTLHHVRLHTVISWCPSGEALIE